MLREKLLTAALDTIFPERCAHCSCIIARTTPRSALCEACSKQIQPLGGFFCPRCHRRLYEPRPLCHKDEKIAVHAATFYASPVARSLIHALKYDHFLPAGEFLGTLIATTLLQALTVSSRKETPYTIVPIPLHKKRFRSRGYNQSEIIAETLYKILSKESLFISYEPQLLIRTKNTAPQVEQKSDEVRAKNVLCAFEVQNENLHNKNILLVDDVFTSGATLREATTKLRERGAKEIIGVVAGRSERSL